MWVQFTNSVIWIHSMHFLGPNSRIVIWLKFINLVIWVQTTNNLGPIHKLCGSTFKFLQVRKSQNGNPMDTNVNDLQKLDLHVTSSCCWAGGMEGKNHHYLQEQICPFPYKSTLIWLESKGDLFFTFQFWKWELYISSYGFKFHLDYFNNVYVGLKTREKDFFIIVVQSNFFYFICSAASSINVITFCKLHHELFLIYAPATLGY